MSNECTLTDQELINKIDSLNSALCKSGGKSWRLSVPPDVNNDPDLLIAELVKRFERAKIDETIDKLPMWTEIHIQPMDIKDVENSRVYWLKHPQRQWTVYDTNLTTAINDFLTAWELSNDK